MSVLLAVLATTLGKWIIGAAAVILAMLGAYVKGRHDKGKSAALDQKAKEADAYAKHIKDVEDAAYARDHISDSLSDDPHNRDNGKT
jgi:hypothetical protein